MLVLISDPLCCRITHFCFMSSLHKQGAETLLVKGYSFHYFLHFPLSLVFHLDKTRGFTLLPFFPFILVSLPFSQPDLMVSSGHLLLINRNFQINELRMRAMLGGAGPSPDSSGPHQF